MDTHDYLSLQEVHLDSNESWENFGSGFLLMFVKSGDAKFVSGSTTQRLSCGDVFVVNSVVDGALHTREHETISFSHFAGSIEHLYPLFSGNEIALAHQVAETFKRPRLFPATKPIATECHKLAAEAIAKSGLDHRSHLLKIVSIVLSDEFKTAQLKRTGSMGTEGHVIKIFERLSVKDLLALSVDEIAVKFSCSRRHLNRLFHQYFGFSVGSLKMEIRLLKAVSLLRDSSAKVINVAAEAGFNHLGLFNTCFKRRFGVSPGEWRKLTTQVAREIPSGTGCGACQQLATGLCPLMISSNSCEPVIRGLQVVHAQRPNQLPVLDELQDE